MEATDDVEASVRMFILNKIIVREEAPGELGDDTHLVDSGIVDSMNVLQLVDFAEEGYDIELEPEDIAEMISISNIARIIRSGIWLRRPT